MPSPPVKQKITELFGQPTEVRLAGSKWAALIGGQGCPFLGRKCLKNRKSSPEISIGTCVVRHGKQGRPVVICPHRLLERNQIFLDSIHLLSSHEPGNEIHVVPEVSIPGGNVDYFLASVKRDKVVDFVGVELQTLDTTGTVWPERQRFLHSVGLQVAAADRNSTSPYGMNWKMTAKTILVQLHHKVSTFEHLGKRFVLVLQDDLLSYMRSEFNFSHVTGVRLGDPMHFHGYSLVATSESHRLELAERVSTDSAGIAQALGLKAEARVELKSILNAIQQKISPSTLLKIR